MKNKKCKAITGSIALGVTAIGAYVATHHLRCRVEESRLKAPGKVVKVNGHGLHVYGMGKSDEGAPTFVMLSALGIPGPVYFYNNIMKELSKSHRIVLVERAGMGYSDESQRSKGVEVILEETREALKQSGEEGPYILMAHSIGGFEARYWASKYPKEVSSIIGLDMVLPEYELAEIEGDNVDKIFTKTNKALIKFLGLGRLEFLYQSFLPTKVYRKNLTEEEAEQDKYLVNKDLMSTASIEEIEEEKSNARKVLEAPFPQCPVVLFISDPSQTSYIDELWSTKALELERKYPNVKVIELDTDHNVHLHKLDVIMRYIMPEEVSGKEKEKEKDEDENKDN